MNFSKLASRTGLITVTAGMLTLAGCYIVPIDHSRDVSRYPPSGQSNPTPAVLPSPVSFTARLYPSNDVATPYGMVIAQVSSDLNGKGSFSTVISGESFYGEATRTASGTRSGIANGAGNRGNYIACRYQMNSATLGTGQCKLSTGAEFSMHVGG
jgi:hypothetical protein